MAPAVAIVFSSPCRSNCSISSSFRSKRGAILLNTLFPRCSCGNPEFRSLTLKSSRNIKRHCASAASGSYSSNKFELAESNVTTYQRFTQTSALQSEDDDEREAAQACLTAGYVPRRYSNKFIRWVKLGSLINDAAMAFFKSEVRRRTFVTVALLIICRAGQFLPLPGFSRGSMPSDIFALSADGEHASMPKMSLFQLGLSPYICSSTVIHLICSWYPPFKQLRKDGEVDKIKSYMWWLTLFCAMFQSLLYSFGTFQYAVTKSAKHLFITASLLTSGAMLLESLSRKITEAGFGQGSTLIICTGILVSFSHSLQSMVKSFSRTTYSQWGPALLAYAGIFLIMTACAVLVTEGRRIIKLQFYGFDRFPSSGGDGLSEVEPYIPFDINPEGMLPVYMSSYIMAVPGFLANILNFQFLRRLQILLNPAMPPSPGAQPWLYHTLTAALILLFSIVDVSDGAKDISEYINRIGAKIADVKPGRSTIEFLRRVQTSSRTWGGLLLALLVTVSTLVDYKLRSWHQTGGISFTSMLFIVGTIIEVRRSVLAYHSMHTLSKVLRRYGAV